MCGISSRNRIALNTGEQAITYDFDALNRLQAVTESGQTTAYHYNAVGNRASVDYPNGVSAIYYYDVRNRLTRLEHRRDDSVIAYYHYDANDRLICENGAMTTVYTYDANRLRGQFYCVEFKD